MKKRFRNSASSKVNKPVRIISTEGVFVSIFNALARDFQRFRNVGTLPRIKSIKESRDIKLPPLTDNLLDIKAYKAVYQLKNLLKRVTAVDDKYSTAEREDLTVGSWLKNLEHINTVRTLNAPFLRPVIGRARKIIRDILGPLEMEDVLAHARFGKRASIGVPFQESYLDVKMAYPLTCSPWGSSNYLEKIANSDVMLASFLEYRRKVELERWDRLSVEARKKSKKHRPDSKYKLVDVLRLSLVPKKFDKLRPVMPYPTFDTYMTLGIGDLIVSRLKEAGHDLSRKQAIHRRRMFDLSLSRKGATLDLTAASDTVTRQTARLLLPARWYSLLKKFSFRKVKLPNSDRVVHSETFAGMGCGFTFPLQSLIFYSVIKAVVELLPAQGAVSVYGDDCILPTTAVPYVERVFSQLGFIVNREKSFAARFFRESCGEDCYRGVSVRPFAPECAVGELSGNQGLAFLYKLLNGLMARWDCTEIPSTYELLCKEICMQGGEVLLVPPFQPDTAGLKVCDPDFSMPWFIPCHRPVLVTPKRTRLSKSEEQVLARLKRTRKTVAQLWLTRLESPPQLEPVWCYKALRSKTSERHVEWVYPFYWEVLRGSSKKADQPAWEPYMEPSDDPTILGYSRRNPGDAGKSPYVARKGVTSYVSQAVAGPWDGENLI